MLNSENQIRNFIYTMDSIMKNVNERLWGEYTIKLKQLPLNTGTMGSGFSLSTLQYLQTQ